jgi:hypothetical protein
MVCTGWCCISCFFGFSYGSCLRVFQRRRTGHHCSATVTHRCHSDLFGLKPRVEKKDNAWILPWTLGRSASGYNGIFWRNVHPEVCLQQAGVIALSSHVSSTYLNTNLRGQHMFGRCRHHCPTAPLAKSSLLRAKRHLLIFGTAVELLLMTKMHHFTLARKHGWR